MPQVDKNYSEIQTLREELYWMRERWEFDEDIPLFHAEYSYKQKKLERLLAGEVIDWIKDGF